MLFKFISILFKERQIKCYYVYWLFESIQLLDFYGNILIAGVSSWLCGGERKLSDIWSYLLLSGLGKHTISTVEGVEDDEPTAQTKTHPKQYSLSYLEVISVEHVHTEH